LQVRKTRKQRIISTSEGAVIANFKVSDIFIIGGHPEAPGTGFGEKKRAEYYERNNVRSELCLSKAMPWGNGRESATTFAA